MVVLQWLINEGLFQDVLSALVFGAFGWVVAKFKLLPLWHKHLRNQEAILRAMKAPPHE